MLADGLVIVGIYAFMRLLLAWVPTRHDQDSLGTGQIVLRVLLALSLCVIAFLTIDIVMQAQSATAGIPPRLR